jgi:hypothetical protein
MAVSATSRVVRTFEDRAEALAHFFVRAGEAPRLLAYDETVGCPLDQALAALEWTAAVGILADDDQVHAARLGPDSAAVLVERRSDDRRTYVYYGPRMEGPLTEPAEGELMVDEPGVRAYRFIERAAALGHFLRATNGQGAVLALLGRRAPELRHIRRWTQTLFSDYVAGDATALLAGWFATSGAGYLFVPAAGEAFVYREILIDG